MTEALERAARALADHFGCEWGTMRDADRENIRGYARAVLLAVRSSEIVHDHPVGRANFAVMIDAILGEEGLWLTT